MEIRDENRKKTNILKLESIHWLAIAVISFIALLAYIYHLNFKCDTIEMYVLCPPSTKEEWGQFGDYLGGVLNPIIGCFTFLLVFYTSSKQLDFLRAEAQHRNDSQQTIVLEKIIRYLEKDFKKDCAVGTGVGPNEYKSVADALENLAYLCKQKNDEQRWRKQLEYIDSNCITLLINANLLEEFLLNMDSFKALVDENAVVIAGAFKSAKHMAGFLYFLKIKYQSDSFKSDVTFRKTEMILKILLTTVLVDAVEEIEAFNI